MLPSDGSLAPPTGLSWRARAVAEPEALLPGVPLGRLPMRPLPLPPADPGLDPGLDPILALPSIRPAARRALNPVDPSY